MSYNIKLKVRIINNLKTENISLSQISIREGIPKQTLSRWIKLYKKFGYSGLENNKPGAKNKPINEKFEKLVMNMWIERKRSAYQMRKNILGSRIRNGHEVSERQIKKIYEKNNLKLD